MKIPLSYVVGAVALYLLVTGKAQDLLGLKGAETSGPNSRPGGLPGWTDPASQPPTANGPDIGGVVKSVADFGGKLIDWLNPPKSTGSGGAPTPSSPSASVPPYLAANSNDGFKLPFFG